jgi:hypothetical protein
VLGQLCDGRFLHHQLACEAVQLFDEHHMWD